MMLSKTTKKYEINWLCKPRHRFTKKQWPFKSTTKVKGVKVVDALWFKIL
jgi:hypothetical protein